MSILDRSPLAAAQKVLADNPDVVAAAANAAQSTAGLVPVWKASTAYTAGQRAISPGGDIVTATTAFTSGATYNPANWTASTQDGRLGSVEAESAAQDGRIGAIEGAAASLEARVSGAESKNAAQDAAITAAHDDAVGAAKVHTDAAVAADRARLASLESVSPKVSNIALDTDGNPYFSPGSTEVHVIPDGDGEPYYITFLQASADTDGNPYF